MENIIKLINLVVILMQGAKVEWFLETFGARNDGQNMSDYHHMLVITPISRQVWGEGGV